MYENVRHRMPRISLGTVYRNLDLLAEHGIIQKLELSGSQKRFDSTTAPHYHVRCVFCGRIDDVAMERLSSVEDDIRTRSDYHILGHKLEFLGVCPVCQKERASSHGENANTV